MLRAGTVPYREAVALQDGLVRDRREERTSDTLVLLEHPHVITSGSGGDPAHILAGPEELTRRGIAVVESGRGGDVTYHGPGQLVGYPILDLKPDRRDLHAYLRALERMLIGVLGELGLPGVQTPGLTGVWVDGAKVAAIGIRVSSGWITSHGFALNVAPDLAYFETIVPCGIQDRSVASLSLLLGRRVSVDEAADAVVRGMVQEFGYGAVDEGAANS